MTLRTLSFALTLLAACSSGPKLPEPVQAPSSAAPNASTPQPPQPPPPDVVVIETASGHAQGFVIEAEGFVLTTYAPLVDPKIGALPDQLRVAVWESGVRSSHSASIVGIEPTLNLAILQLDVDRPLRASPMVRESEIVVGQPVIAAFVDGDRPRAVNGTISALSAKECYQESLTATMLRAVIALPEAAVGAPLRTENGAVVALNTGYQPPPDAEPVPAEAEHALRPGETPVLPIELAMNIYEGLKQRRNMHSPWTGFSVRSLTEAERAHFPTVRRHQGGVAIEHVWNGSPAEKMGVQVDDILVQFAHYHVTSVAEFQQYLYSYGVGPQVELVFVRGGADYLVADYTIEERPDWAKPR